MGTIERIADVLDDARPADFLACGLWAAFMILVTLL